MEWIGKIHNGRVLTEEDLPELKKTIELYPYFQAPKMWYLYLLHNSDTAEYEKALRQMAVGIASPVALYRLIHYGPGQATSKTPEVRNSDEAETAPVVRSGTNSSLTDKVDEENDVQSEPVEPEPDSKDKRTFSLIESFLSEYVPESDDDTLLPLSENTSATSDYTGYLESLPAETIDDDSTSFENCSEAPVAEAVEEKESDDRERSEISEASPDLSSRPAPRPIPRKKTEVTDESTAVDTSAGEGISDKYFTETLAKIYVKQGKYSKALEIIQRLYLRDPNKNIYFADQIRYLEKLIINSRNQKGKK